jgi:hypothetical protein
MRCIAGLALFLALYFGSCTILAGAVRSSSGPRVGAEALRKYHALVAVGAGAVYLAVCTVPGVLFPEKPTGGVAPVGRMERRTLMRARTR